MEAESISDWYATARIDGTLAVSKGLFKTLAGRELRAQRYARRKLFSAMAREEPILFLDFPLRSTLQPFFVTADEPGEILKTLFSARSTTLAKAGPAQRNKYMRIHDVIDIWRRNRARLSANDIYFRNRKLDRAFDCAAISDFNVIPNLPARIRELEVATLLMGTTGCMTDSHSDDPDGCNYCISGKKLWLIWDGAEGRQVGLQDCEYDDVTERAKFDLEGFLSLPSARWFLVSKGKTLFLPGRFTHKVITLERYLGISSFYVGFPNALSSLTRWKLRGATMVIEDDWRQIAKGVIAQLRETANNDRHEKHKWGFHHVAESLIYWERRYSRTEKRRIQAEPLFRELREEMLALSRK